MRKVFLMSAEGLVTFGMCVFLCGVHLLLLPLIIVVLIWGRRGFDAEHQGAGGKHLQTINA